MFSLFLFKLFAFIIWLNIGKSSYKIRFPWFYWPFSSKYHSISFYYLLFHFRLCFVEFNWMFSQAIQLNVQQIYHFGCIHFSLALDSILFSMVILKTHLFNLYITMYSLADIFGYSLKIVQFRMWINRLMEYKKKKKNIRLLHGDKWFTNICLFVCCWSDQWNLIFRLNTLNSFILLDNRKIPI